MLLRCYSKKEKLKLPTYDKCVVCDDWLTFSKFKLWFDKNHVEGWQLDKDLLFEGNKLYSPETCIFVPRRFNTLTTKRSRKKTTPMGVSIDHQNRYYAYVSDGAKTISLGHYDKVEEAELAYSIGKCIVVSDAIEKHRHINNKKLQNLFDVLKCRYSLESYNDFDVNRIKNQFIKNSRNITIKL